MEAFIKAVGAGEKRARALDRDEARQAMAAIASGAAQPVQVGAFLLALRMKGETALELAGFCDALQPHIARFDGPDDLLEVDGHGDGHEGVVSLLPAALAAAAALGVPACLGVDLGSPFSHHGFEASLAAIGLGGVLTPERAARDLAKAGIAACDLKLICPPLARLVALRTLLGVRSTAHTLAKLASPSGAKRRLLGVFHAPYVEPTAEAERLLGCDRAVVVQALGGLPEARPGKLVRVAYAADARATSIDLRDFMAVGGESIDVNVQAAAANRAALDGEEVRARQAAATCALLVHAATGEEAPAAAERALAALTSGRARQVVAKLAAA